MSNVPEKPPEAEPFVPESMSVEHARIKLAERYVIAVHELERISTDKELTALGKSTLALGSVINMFDGDIAVTQSGVTQPLVALFAALYDLSHGGRPALLFSAERPDDVVTKPKVRIRDIVRGYHAAAVDVLIAANMSRSDVKIWWGRPTEVTRALRWRDEVHAGTAPSLVAKKFHELRPNSRQPVTLDEAKDLAEQWREVGPQRGVTPV